MNRQEEKNEILLRAIGQADSDLIAEAAAAEAKPEKKFSVPLFVKWGAAAACLLLLAGGGIGIFNANRKAVSPLPDGSGTSEVGTAGNTAATPGQIADICKPTPWDELSDAARYQSIDFHGKTYYLLPDAELSGEMLGEAIGDVTASGYDYDQRRDMEQVAPAYRITGISEGYAVAVRLGDGSIYACQRTDYRPATLKEFFDDLNLTGTLLVANAYTYGGTIGRDEKRYYRLSGFDHDAFRERLFACAEATTTDGWIPLENRLLSVSVTVPGIVAKDYDIWIDGDGWLGTNLIPVPVKFRVGKERTEAIFRLITEGSVIEEIWEYDGGGTPE